MKRGFHAGAACLFVAATAATTVAAQGKGAPKVATKTAASGNSANVGASANVSGGGGADPQVNEEQESTLPVVDVKLIESEWDSATQNEVPRSAALEAYVDQEIKKAQRKGKDEAEAGFGARDTWGKATISQSTKRSRVRITLYQMPPTRTDCTFDPKDGGRSTTVEWDPLRPGSLAREITLDNTKYRFSCHAEPARHALKPAMNFAWDFRELSKESTDGGRKFIHFSVCARNGRERCDDFTLGEVRPVALPSIRAPEPGAELQAGSLPLNTFRLSTIAGPSAALQPGSVQRAFGGIPEEAVTELFQVIAEVAMERVRAQGMKLLQTKIQALICLEKNRPPPKLALPKTCEAVRHVRLDDLAGAGKQIVEALGQDFLEIGARSLITQLTQNLGSTASQEIFKNIEPILKEVVTIVVDAIVNRHERFAGAGPRIIAALNNLTWRPKTLDFPKDIPGYRALTPAQRTQLRTDEAIHVAFAILAEVQHAGKVDADKVREMIASPELFFSGMISDLKDLPDQDKLDESKALRDLLGRWTRLPTLISSAAHILSPSPDMTEVARLRGAIGIVFDLAELVANETNCACPKQDMMAWFDGGRALLEASIQEDLPKTITAAGSLLALPTKGSGGNPASDDVRKITRLAGALGSYLSTYTSGQKPSEQEIKARHEARKAALNSLIDAQLARSERPDTWIVSVGGTLGMTPAGSWPAGASAGAFQLQPSLTVALAVDKHFSCDWGFHGELAPINLGSYLTFRTSTTTDATTDNQAAIVPPSAADVLSPSVTLAASHLFKEENLMLIIGPTMGYSFKAGNDTSVPNRAGYLGVTAGFYFPFFDFN